MSTAQSTIPIPLRVAREIHRELVKRKVIRAKRAQFPMGNRNKLLPGQNIMEPYI